jgi:glutamine---fructose-6-phosphate transaminase (isomerizing)
MCGIVGYTGHRPALGFLRSGLHRLEYRGYDSAGVATLEHARLEVTKTVGTLAALEQALAAAPPGGTVGIGHTRWATHGRPSNANAHPHTDCGGRLAVVHNGIIENYRELRRDLAAQGHRFRSETDTEVIAHLIERFRDLGLPGAVRSAARELRGAYAIACIDASAADTVVAARRGGAPLVIGVGAGETFLASDVAALLGETREVIVLEEDELAVLRRGAIAIETLDGAEVRRPSPARGTRTRPGGRATRTTC